VAYQIRDDIADVVGRKGRERASDLRSWKMSAVLVHYVRTRGVAVIGSKDPGMDSPPLTDLTLERRVDDVLGSGAIATALLQQRAVLGRANQEASVLPRAVAQVVSALGREIELSSLDMSRELTGRKDAV
jgi:geranylgeranyl pyrophosphate synthase